MVANRRKAGKEPVATPGAKEVRTVTETVELVPPGDELDLETLDPPDPDEDFQSVLAELGGGSEAKCEVRRSSPAEFAGYCCTYALSEMSLDRLQAEFGGGKYSIRVRTSRGEFKGSTNVQIAGKPKNRDDAPAVVSAAPAAPQLDIAGIVTAVNATNKTQIDLLTTLVTTLINKPAPEIPKGPDTLAVISALVPILKPEKREDTPADAVKLLMQGIDLGKELGGGGDGDSFTNLALKGIDMVKTVAQTSPQRPVQRIQRQPPPRPLALPPGTVAAEEATPVTAAPQQEPSPMLKLLGWIKQQATLLCYQAARGKNPDLYAELFLDNLPAGVTLEQIHQRLTGPNAIAELADITGNAEVMKHVPWFEAWRDAVLRQLTDDDEETQDVDDPGPPGALDGQGGTEGNL